MRVFDARQHPRLVQELGFLRVIETPRDVDDLERHVPLEAGVPGPVDRGEAAMAETLPDLERGSERGLQTGPHGVRVVLTVHGAAHSFAAASSAATSSARGGALRRKARSSVLATMIAAPATLQPLG